MSNKLKKNYSPTDILKYVLENDLESDFLVKVMLHKDGFSIAEITDGRFERVDTEYIFKSAAFELSVPVKDPDVRRGLYEGRYISAFISKGDNGRGLHFFVHECTALQKADFEETIAAEVVQYMILTTIKVLRLDSPEKIKKYLEV